MGSVIPIKLPQAGSNENRRIGVIGCRRRNLLSLRKEKNPPTSKPIIRLSGYWILKKSEKLVGG